MNALLSEASHAMAHTASPAAALPREEPETGFVRNTRFFGLGEDFYVPVRPTALAAPYWVGHSTAVAQLLQLAPDWPNDDSWLQALSGNRSFPGATPVASVYSGHQFGVWAGQLGDGRAILMGEIGGQEVQLKGAGLTPFSRMGDGRAVLRSSIREFLCSEAMHGLGIPTTRALAVTGSDAGVLRETLETAAVVTRVAPSFIRFGHFEHFYHHDQQEQLRVLADFVIDHFYPGCRTGDDTADNAYARLLAAVTARTASLMAHWQSVGFCHGVMNTDNMSILGLTIDYGPFQFLDGYDPHNICNHSDSQGRYAFYKQPQIAYWNLFCLGQALMPLIGEQDHAIAALETYKTLYPQAFARRMAAKLGLANPLPVVADSVPDTKGAAIAPADVAALIEEVLRLLAAEQVDFTIFWRMLSHCVHGGLQDLSPVQDLFVDRPGIDAWLLRYSEHLSPMDRAVAGEWMLKTNPKFVLRNHLGELAIRAARGKDFSLVAGLLKVLERPYDEHPEHADWAGGAPEWARDISISCSS